MPVIAAPSGSHHLRIARRGALAAVGVGLAAALSVASVSNSWLAHAVGEAVSEGVHGVKTVAAMLAERSPGARPEGALTNLKHKRQAMLSDHALPKIRGAFSPPTAYEALAGPPTTPIAPPAPSAPLYNTAAGGPSVVVPPTTVSTPGTSGGPILSNIPPPGG